MCSTSPSAEGPDFVENMRRYAQPKLNLSYSSVVTHNRKFFIIKKRGYFYIIKGKGVRGMTKSSTAS